MKEITWDVVAQTLAWIGTGGWLAYVIKGHGRRLGVFEESIDALEKALPAELEKRLRTLEQEKLGTNEHAAICKSALQRVEVMVSGIKEAVEQHSKRLDKGDDLFRELAALSGELRATLNHARKNGSLGGPPGGG
jgi:chromosome segregation ATPase